MGTSDLWMRDLLIKYGFVLVIFVILSSLISWKWSRFRQHNFRSFLLGFESECAELASAHKKRLFSVLDHTSSQDETLRSTKQLRLLEIGVKTGDNIQYYPEGTHFIGVDWNLKLGEYLINGDRSWQFTHIIFEKIVIGDGSSLKGVSSGSVDVVVTTRSLCSTKSVDRTLKEIRRVLAPGGKYLFFEHVPEDQGSVIGWIQMVLTELKIWPSLFGGCRLNSNPTQNIMKCGFANVKYETVTLQGYVSQPHHLLLSRRHIVGIAIR